MSVQITIKCSTLMIRQTRRLFVDPTKDVMELQETLKNQFGIPLNEQVITFSTRGFEVRVVPGFSLEFFGVGNNAILNLRRLDFQSSNDADEGVSTMDDEVINDSLDKRLETMNRLRIADRAKYDLLQIIREVEETDEDDNPIDNLKKRFLEITKIKAVREFDSILPQLLSLDFASQMMVVEATDKVGWTGVHYAVLYNEEYIIRELLKVFKQEILNIISADGWSPMLLAVHNNHWNLFKIMAEHATTEQIYFETSKGCLLHLIFRSADFETIENLLLKRDLDPIKENFSGRQAITYLSQDQQKHILMLLEMKKIPPKPTNMFFEASSWRFFFGWSNLCFFINAERRSMELYDSPKYYPFKPKDVIPLHGIEQITFKISGKVAEETVIFEPELNEMTNSSKSRRKLSEPQTFDLEFQYGDSNYAYRFSSLDKMRIVVKTLKVAIEWSKYFDQFISKMKNADIKDHAMKLWKAHSTQFDTFDLYSKKEVKRWKYMQTQTQIAKSLANNPTHAKLSDFEIMKLLGRGTFGKVYKVMHLKTKRILAMKVLSKKQLIRAKQIKYSLIEKRILQGNIAHPFLISLHFAFQTVDALFLVFDFCPHRDFGELLSHMPEERMLEPTAKFYIAELLLALEEMHRKHYIHRDLKPENMLIDECGHLKLADFGLAAENIRSKNQYAQSSCGSPVYMAAELLIKDSVRAYRASDYYSFGVVVFQILTGQFPFLADDLNELKQLIIKGKFEFPSKLTLSAEAKDLISGLLKTNPKSRLGARRGVEEIKNHPFFQDIDWNAMLKCAIPPPITFAPPVHNFSKKITLKVTEYQLGCLRSNYLPNFDFTRDDYI